MEPNKIEKQFREKLSAREIQPSAQAWDRLDAMLSVAEEKKTNRPFGFLFIAASILVFVTLGLFLFNQNNSDTNIQNTVVGTEINKDTVQNSVKNSQNTIVEAPITNKVIDTKRNQPETRNSKPETRNTIIKDKEIEYLVTQDIAIKDLPRIRKSDTIIIKSKNQIKSDEALVADLNKTTLQLTNTKSTIKVDTKSLLSQANGEVEQTFREKILTKINKNYKEVKVALANRNNQ